MIVSERNIWVSSSSIVDFVVELKAIAAFLVGYGGGGVSVLPIYHEAHAVKST